MEMPVKKSNTTRRMEQNVRETGLKEKTDLKESLIGHAPLYLVCWQDWKSAQRALVSAQRALVSYEVDYLLRVLKIVVMKKRFTGAVICHST
jgi:hypothetical protein